MLLGLHESEDECTKTLNCQYQFADWYGVTSNNTDIFNTTVRNSDLVTPLWFLILCVDYYHNDHMVWGL